MKTSNHYFEEAFQAHQLGDLTKAIEYYQQALNHTTDPTKILELLGIAHAQQQNYPEALHYFQKALQHSPHALSLQNNLATCYKKMNDVKKAIHIYQNILKHHPMNCVTHNNLATLYMQQAQYNQAENHLLKALLLQPKYPDAYYNLALCQSHTQSRDASPLLQQADKLNHPYAAYTYAMHLESQNQPKQAKLMYQKSIQNLENHALSHHGLARVLLALGEDTEALAHFINAQRIDPTIPNLMENIAAYYHLKGQFTHAIEYWSKAPRTSENTMDIQYNIACAYMYANRHTEALEYFMSILEKDPDHRNAHMNIAAIALQNNQKAVAIRHYEKALTLDPKNEEIQFILLALKNKQNHNLEAPKAYVTNLFDQYASHYDQHLTQMLRYQLPEKITLLLHETFKPKGQLQILDLGCGTGLLAATLKPFASTLVGVDLSPNMLSKAKNTQAYTDLKEMDALDYLQHHLEHDLIVCAELFPYIGNPTPLLQAIYRSLNNNGHLVFSIENNTTPTLYQLSENARFLHHPDSITECLTQSGFIIISKDPTTLRLHQTKPVTGTIFHCQKMV